MSSILAEFLREGAEREEYEWVGGCSGKIQHESHSEALAVINRMNKTPGKGRNLEAYRCSACGCWHTGTLRGGRRRGFD